MSTSPSSAAARPGTRRRSAPRSSARNVACIEREPELGGTCLRVGCIPTKAWVQTAHALHAAREIDPKLGVDHRRADARLRPGERVEGRRRQADDRRRRVALQGERRRVGEGRRAASATRTRSRSRAARTSPSRARSSRRARSRSGRRSRASTRRAVSTRPGSSRRPRCRGGSSSSAAGSSAASSPPSSSASGPR